MTSDSQLDRIEELKDRIESLEAEFEEMDDKDKADLEQEQALRAARRSLKKAGAHVGYANSNRHADDAERRLDGIEATVGL